MAAPSECVFDLASPRRPGDDDVDATLVNDDGTTGYLAAGFPYSDQLNQWAKLCKAAGVMIPVAIIEVHFSAGTPSIYAVQCVRSTTVAGDFTLDGSITGDTIITWAADTFPIAASSPEAYVVDAAGGSWLQPTCSSPSNGVRVKTRNSAGVLTDIDFKVHIY